MPVARPDKMKNSGLWLWNKCQNAAKKLLAKKHALLQAPLPKKLLPKALQKPARNKIYNISVAYMQNTPEQTFRSVFLSAVIKLYRHKRSSDTVCMVKVSLASESAAKSTTHS